jgi:hypothetical protein
MMREFAESGTEVPGLYMMPERHQSSNPYWESLHRAYTCLVGIGAWSGELSILKNRPEPWGLFGFCPGVTRTSRTNPKSRRAVGLTEAKKKIEHERKQRCVPNFSFDNFLVAENHDTGIRKAAEQGSDKDLHETATAVATAGVASQHAENIQVIPSRMRLTA